MHVTCKARRHLLLFMLYKVHNVLQLDTIGLKHQRTVHIIYKPNLSIILTSYMMLSISVIMLLNIDRIKEIKLRQIRIIKYTVKNSSVLLYLFSTVKILGNMIHVHAFAV